MEHYGTCNQKPTSKLIRVAIMRSCALPQVERTKVLCHPLNKAENPPSDAGLSWNTNEPAKWAIWLRSPCFGEGRPSVPLGSRSQASHWKTILTSADSEISPITKRHKRWWGGKRQGGSERKINKTDLEAVVTGVGPNSKRTTLVAAN